MSSLVHGIGKIFQPLLDLVGGILAFFYSVIPSYPIDVALLTIVIMALLTPLTVKSTKNMAAMQALGPEMKKLQQKYKGAENRAQMNEEMMKLYKEHNVNPASGCLPMLLQMPAFFVLYSVIKGLTNTITYPQVTKTTAAGLKVVIPEHVVAHPRYISPSTKMYHAIVAAHGRLISGGIDFSQKLLSHHSSLWAAIPFLLLVLGSVGLQYLQMSRLNARNPQAAQANPQAAMMQKYMPLIFGLIYLNVAAILNVYFIVSSFIRIATQEVLFRKGMVAGPPSAPKAGTSPSGTKKGPVADRTEKALPKPKTSNASGSAKTAAGNGTGPSSAGRGRKQPAADGKPPSEAKAADTKAAGAASGTNGKAGTGSGTGGRPAKKTSPASGNGSGSNATPEAEADGSTGSKEHPRSKAKRERKAR